MLHDGLDVSPTSIAAPGATIGLGCQNCALRGLCGRVYSDFDCMGGCRSCDPQLCAAACPRATNFPLAVWDAGGLGMNSNWNIKQSKAQLPAYVTRLGNGSGRSESLSVPMVAVTTFDVMKAESQRLISSPAELRRYFRVDESSRVLALSIGKDNRLERFWEYFELRRFAERLAGLDLELITAPNFSFALDAPRPEHLVNRQRSLRCASACRKRA